MKKVMAVALVTSLLPVAAGAAGWTGKASYYRGNKTASGSRFHTGSMGAAHRTLPFGTPIKVTNLENGRTAHLIVNDRGPFVRGRILDVTTHAAEVLAFRNKGVARVRVETTKD